MRHIFLVYMPPSNRLAMEHYQDTIKQRVSLERIARFVPRTVSERLSRIFAGKSVAVWGSRDTPANRSKFEKMSEGDDLLIVEGDMIRLMGKVALKTVNGDLSRELWDSQGAGRQTSWDLIYFIANSLEINVPFREFSLLFGYETNYQLRGFATVSKTRLEAFYEQYDDLYSILTRIRDGQSVAQKLLPELVPDFAGRVEVEAEDIEQVLASPQVSEHVKMQWKLASLGLKAGEKVWIPTADQKKLQTLYNFNEFEVEFATGIDLPRNYFENIDVVWKEEFRIDAAFEVENSTAIYSGLLRFADLNVVAPNTTYPMFIVAPAERRGRVRDQLLRPVFRQLDMLEKVRFLPYETVDAIDQFFGSSSSGLSVELLQGRAEVLA